MKCQNCKCQVSDQFEYAFTMNCCPKCGKTIMTSEAKLLFKQIKDFLAKDENDVGDLANWFLSQTKPTKDLPLDVQEETDEPVNIVARKEPKPIKPVPQNNTNIFAKRAGVDKIKFETLVKDIQAVSKAEEQSEYPQDVSDSDMDNYFGSDINTNPLNSSEMNQIENIFDTSDSNTVDFKEIERMQKAEQLQLSGSIGKIRRSS